MTELHYIILYFGLGFAIAIFEIAMQVRLDGDNYQTKYGGVALIALFWPIWVVVLLCDFLAFLSPLRRIDQFLIFVFKKRGE